MKMFFMALLSLLMVYLVACSSNQIVSMNDEKVKQVAAEIASIEMPAGYFADFSTTVLGYKVAAYTRGDSPSHIYLIQSENEVDGDKLDQVLEQLVIGSGDPHTRMQVIETRKIRVHGQESTLVISDAVNSEGLTYRQAAVSFQGNGGQALLVLSESLEYWDDADLELLISSIR